MSNLDTDELFCERGMNGLRTDQWVYNSTTELYCQLMIFQQAVKDSYALAIQLKWLFFMIGKAKRAI